MASYEINERKDKTMEYLVEYFDVNQATRTRLVSADVDPNIPEEVLRGILAGKISDGEPRHRKVEKIKRIFSVSISLQDRDAE